MKFKIGIITFHRADNYGAVLQNMALRHTIMQLSSEYDVFTIDYRNKYLEKPYKKNPFERSDGNFIKKIYYRIRKIMVKNKFLKLQENFNEFREKYLNLTESIELDDKNDNYTDLGFDLYITGSDQVWNSKITGNCADVAFSLGFVKEGIPKISYAASAGSIDLMSSSTLDYIKELDCISVREQELKEYLQEQFNREISIVADPVFLLEKNQWSSLIAKEKLFKEKYIFTYCVSEKSADVTKIAKQLARKYNCKIIHLDLSIHYGINGRNYYGTGPLDFVRLIRDAEFVVASSFHAVAFCLIFDKQFVAVPAASTGQRIKNILDLAGLKQCCYNNYQDFIENWTEKKIMKDDSVLKELVDNSYSYLINAMNLMNN